MWEKVQQQVWSNWYNFCFNKQSNRWTPTYCTSVDCHNYLGGDYNPEAKALDALLILPSSVKPQLQPQLLAAAKLAELQPYYAFHPPTPTPHPPTHPVPVDSKLQLGQASSSSNSWLSKQPQLVGSPLKQALICISSTKPSMYASKFWAVAQLSF